jgi:branched-chain amino acid transport system ATP-binding protein
VLEISDLMAGYGSNVVVRGISVHVAEKEIVAIIGSNGAGKTTILRAVSGLIQPSGGKIIFCGTRMEQLDPADIARQKLIHVPEGRGIFPELTVAENLLMGGITVKDKARRARNIELVFDLFPALKTRRSQHGGTLSGGEQQMLAFGRALMAEPRLIMLDEPSMGLSPLLAEKIFDSIRELNARGIAILLVEQNANATLELSHRAYVIENGSIVLEGKSSSLIRQESIKKAYLGLEPERGTGT